MQDTEKKKNKKIYDSETSVMAAEILFLFIFPGLAISSMYSRSGKYGRAAIKSVLFALLMLFVYVLVYIFITNKGIQKDSHKKRHNICSKEAVSGGQISNFKNVKNTSYETQREYAKYKCNSGNGSKRLCLFRENSEVQVQNNNIISPNNIKHSSERNTCNDEKIEVPTGKELVAKCQIHRADYFPKHYINRYQHSNIGNNHLNMDIELYGLFGNLVEFQTNHVLV